MPVIPGSSSMGNVIILRQNPPGYTDPINDSAIWVTGSHGGGSEVLKLGNNITAKAHTFHATGSGVTLLSDGSTTLGNASTDIVLVNSQLTASEGIKITDGDIIIMGDDNDARISWNNTDNQVDFKTDAGMFFSGMNGGPVPLGTGPLQPSRGITIRAEAGQSSIDIGALTAEARNDAGVARGGDMFAALNARIITHASDAGGEYSGLWIEDAEDNGGTSTTYGIKTGANYDEAAHFSSGHVTLAADSAELRFGAGDDLTVTHNGTDSVVMNNTGLLVLNSTNNLVITGSVRMEDSLTIQDDITIRGALSGSGNITIGANGVFNGTIAVAGAAIDNTYGIVLPTAGDGSTGIAAGWPTYSSIIYKTNVKTMSDSLKKIKHLRGVTYDWKETGKKEIGLIAEEVNVVFPEIVHKNSEGAVQSLDYAKLVSVLIESVKELEKRVVELEGGSI